LPVVDPEGQSTAGCGEHLMFKIITIPFDRHKESFDDEALNQFVFNKTVKGFLRV